MRSSTIITLGAMFAITGMTALSWQNFNYPLRETVIDDWTGNVMADRKNYLPMSPILGGIALAGGVGLIVMGARKPPCYE